MKKFLSAWIVLSLLPLFVAAVCATERAQTVNGWVADSKCGAKAAKAGAAACTKACLAAGASIVVVTRR